jgi:hypothetical protein
MEWEDGAYSIKNRDHRKPPQYPIRNAVLHGPDDKPATKIAAGVILHDGADAIINRLDRHEHTDESESPGGAVAAQVGQID